MPESPRRQIVVVATGVTVGLLAADFGRSLLASFRHLGVLLGLALFVSFVMEPVVTGLERRGWRRGVATFTVMSALAAFFATVIVAGGALVVAQGNHLIDNLPSLARSLQGRLGDWGVNVDLVGMSQPGGRIAVAVESLRTAMVGLSSRLLAGVGDGLALMFLVFYMSADGHRLLRAACSLLPAERQQHVFRAWEIAIAKAGGYMYSRFVLAVASGVVHSIAFVLLKVDYPIPLGIWMGVVSQLVPVIGAYLGGALPVVVALGASPARALGVFAVLTVYQQVENLVLSPKVTRSAVSVHPLAGFVAVLGSVAVLGPLGALIAIPVLATVISFTSTMLTRHDLVLPDLLERQTKRAGTRRDPASDDDQL